MDQRVTRASGNARKPPAQAGSALGGHTRLLETLQPGLDSPQEEAEATHPLEEPEPLSPRLGPAVSERSGRSPTCSLRGCGCVRSARGGGDSLGGGP